MAYEDLQGAKITGKLEGAFNMGGSVFIEGKKKPVNIVEMAMENALTESEEETTEEEVDPPK